MARDQKPSSAGERRDNWGEIELDLANTLPRADISKLAALAGVSRRVVRQAHQGRRIATEPYLKLCCALGIDAVTGGVRASGPRPHARCDWALSPSVFVLPACGAARAFALLRFCLEFRQRRFPVPRMQSRSQWNLSWCWPSTLGPRPRSCSGFARILQVLQRPLRVKRRHSLL